MCGRQLEKNIYLQQIKSLGAKQKNNLKNCSKISYLDATKPIKLTDLEKREDIVGWTEGDNDGPPAGISNATISANYYKYYLFTK